MTTKALQKLILKLWNRLPVMPHFILTACITNSVRQLKNFPEDYILFTDGESQIRYTCKDGHVTIILKTTGEAEIYVSTYQSELYRPVNLN